MDKSSLKQNYGMKRRIERRRRKRRRERRMERRTSFVET